MKYFLWLVMKKSSVSCTQRSTYSQILSCVLEWWTRTPNQTLHGNKDWSGSKHLKKTETWTQLMVRQWNSSGIFSQDSPHCNSATMSKSFLSKMSEEPEDFTRRIIFMSMFNDISWGSKDNTKECELSAQLVSLYARRFGARQWSFLGLGSEKNGTLPVKTVHKEKGTESQSKWCWHLENAHTQSSDPRVHCPEECLNAKVVENCQYIVAPIWKRLKLFFAQLFDHLHVDVQRHLRGILRQWTGMRIKRQTHFDLCEKIFTKKMVIPRTRIRKEVVFLLIKANHEENGTESQSWWWWNSVKADTSLPIHESIAPRSAQRQHKWRKIINTLLRWWANDWNCSSHNHFW